MKKNTLIILSLSFLVIIVSFLIFWPRHRTYTIVKNNYKYIKEIPEPKVVKLIDKTESPTEVCTTSEKEWAPGNQESIIINPIDNIYLGNVLSAESLQDGSYMSIGDSTIRMPIKISTNQPNLKINNAVVKTPTLSNVRSAILTIINSDRKGTGIPVLTVNAEEITSKDYLNIYLQGSYSGGGSTVAASFGSLSDLSKRHFLIDITQVYYTISTDDISPNGFFRKKPSNIDNTFPVYVQSMSFGRRIWIIYETSSASKITSADLKAQFSFFAGKASTDNHILNEESLENSSLKVLMVGGNFESLNYTPTSINDLDNLKNLIASGLQFSDSTRGAPLSYTLKECYDKKVFRIVDAGKFTVRECTIKEGHDTTIYAKNLLQYNHKCAVWTHKGDRNFNGDCDITFSMKLIPENNIVYCTIAAEWNEIHGDGTQGQLIIDRQEIIRLPQNYHIISIPSGTIGDIGGGRRANKNSVTDFGPVNPSSSPFRRVSIIGDSPQDDDMINFCDDDVHPQIQKITLNDVKIHYTIKELK